MANPVFLEFLWSYQAYWAERNKLKKSFGEAKNTELEILKANLSHNLGFPFILPLKAGQPFLCDYYERGVYYPWWLKLFPFQMAENPTQTSLNKNGNLFPYVMQHEV